MSPVIRNGDATYHRRWRIGECASKGGRGEKERRGRGVVLAIARVLDLFVEASRSRLRYDQEFVCDKTPLVLACFLPNLVL